MDVSQFQVNEKADEYQVTFRVQVDEMMQEDDFGSELDEVSYVDLDSIRQHPRMYLVKRDGRDMQVSHLREGDQPREPHKYDFI